MLTLQTVNVGFCKQKPIDANHYELYLIGHDARVIVIAIKIIARLFQKLLHCDSADADVDALLYYIFFFSHSRFRFSEFSSIGTYYYTRRRAF